jgi:hypothetical protein
MRSASHRVRGFAGVAECGGGGVASGGAGSMRLVLIF